MTRLALRILLPFVACGFSYYGWMLPAFAALGCWVLVAWLSDDVMVIEVEEETGDG